MNEDFCNIVSKRGFDIIDVCGKTACSSSANAICDHIHDWWFGTQESVVSMGVTTTGNEYGVPDDLIFSFPLDISRDGVWSARKYDLNDF